DLYRAAGAVDEQVQLERMPARRGRHAAYGCRRQGVAAKCELAAGEEQVGAVAGRRIAESQQRHLAALALDLEGDSRVGVRVSAGQGLLGEGRTGRGVAFSGEAAGVDVAVLDS